MQAKARRQKPEQKLRLITFVIFLINLVKSTLF